jgi:hypothetical protein
MPKQKRPQLSGSLRDGGIDAGLLLLSLVTPRGVTRTLDEIAFVCGCTKNNIYLIEKRALKKMRNPVRSRRFEQFLRGGADEQRAGRRAHRRLCALQYYRSA